MVHDGQSSFKQRQVMGCYVTVYTAPDRCLECSKLAIFIHLGQSSDLSSAYLAKKTQMILSFDSR